MQKHIKRFYKIQNKIRSLELSNYLIDHNSIEHLWNEQKIEKLRKELHENKMEGK